MATANPIGCCEVHTACCPDAIPELLTATVIIRPTSSDGHDNIDEFLLSLDDLEQLDDQFEQAAWRSLDGPNHQVEYDVRDEELGRWQASPELWLKCDGARWSLRIGESTALPASETSSCDPLSLEFLVRASERCFPEIANDLLITVTT